MQRFICLDTEDDSQGNVTIINFFDGENHVTLKGKNLRFRAWSYLNSIAPRKKELALHCWAVNCEYDLINLFGSEWLTHLVTLQYVKSGLMRGIYQEGKITFLDTLRHWAASVEAMGKMIGLPKLSMPHLGCDCDDCVTYCQRDTEITWLFVNEMIGRYEALGLERIKSTLPSMAMDLFKTFYFKDFPVQDDYYKRSFRAAYFGGRVEIYKLGEINGPINHYDVNSLFPSVMKDFSFPELSTGEVTYSPDLSKEGVFEGWVFVPETYFPCLPVRDEEIIFPTGGLYGTWVYPEIRQLLEDGGRIIKCKEAIEFKETENPFDRYVDFCYGKRLESTDELDKTHYKLLLNSLYGKFGSHGTITVIKNDEQSEIGGEAKYSNVIWSAYVTAYGRLRLLNYLRSAEPVYYTDTDSLFTSRVLQTDSALGKLKLEGIASRAEFKGNKLYLLEYTEPKHFELIKAKGVPRKMAGDFFRTGRAVYRKPARFRESLRTENKANVWYDVEKESRKDYTKRKILENGETEPWNIDEYRRFIKENKK